MGSKRKWWLADERFKKVHKDLRLNYDRSLEQRAEEFRTKELALKREYEQKVAVNERRYRELLTDHEERLARLSRDVMRIRLTFGPTQFTSRYTLSATMDESFMKHSVALKENSEYIIRMLAAKIAREFAQIDFCRAKPVDFNSSEHDVRFPRWVIEEPKR